MNYVLMISITLCALALLSGFAILRIFHLIKNGLSQSTLTRFDALLLNVPLVALFLWSSVLGMGVGLGTLLWILITGE